MDPASTTVAALEAHWALGAAGLSDLVWGHSSVRAADGGGIVTKASGWSFEEIDEGRLVHVAWDATKTAGTGKVHLEVPIHLQVMQARPDVHCVVHTHAPSVAAFASLNEPLRPISHDGVPFAERLPRFEATGNLIDTASLGAQLADALGDAPAVIIPAHGMVSAGPDPASAVMYAVLLERACRTHLMAAGAGGPAVWSDAAEVAAKRAKAWPPSQLHAGYGYLVRKGTAEHRATLT